MIYVLIILLADYRSGAWRGCAQALARVTGWSVRQCQLILKSLREKGYVTGKPSAGRGQYMIRVNKYFAKANGDAPSMPEGEPGCAFRPKKANGDATYQEVSSYKKKREEETVRLSPKGLKRASDYVKGLHARPN